MYYDDLKPYKIGKKFYPKTLNIGWLDSGMDYLRGSVPTHLIRKLHELTLLDLDQGDAYKLGIVAHPRNIVVHTMHMRGSPFECPFCHTVIALIDEQNRIMKLGRNEMNIPIPNRPSFVYNFPTLLYHYITGHNYLPPTEFLEALEAFPMDQPYDCTKEGY